MARTYARIKVDIWNDDDFRRLPPASQHLYLLLITDPALSYCGVTDWRPKRIAGKAEAWTAEHVELAACPLVDARLIVVCEDTEEVLVRSFLRHDGVLQNAKLAVSAANAVGAVASNGIRSVLTHELKRLKKQEPEWVCWNVGKMLSALKNQADDPRQIDPFGPDFAPGLGRIWANLRTDLAQGLDEGLDEGLAQPLAQGLDEGLGLPPYIQQPQPSSSINGSEISVPHQRGDVKNGAAVEAQQTERATPEQVAAALALAKQALSGPGEREL